MSDWNMNPNAPKETAMGRFAPIGGGRSALQDIKDFENMIEGLQGHQTVVVTVERLRSLISQANMTTDPALDEAIFYRNDAMRRLSEALEEIARLKAQLAGEQVREVAIAAEEIDLVRERGSSPEGR